MSLTKINTVFEGNQPGGNRPSAIADGRRQVLYVQEAFLYRSPPSSCAGGEGFGESFRPLHARTVFRTLCAAGKIPRMPRLR
jgi:hypothetical protein